MFPIESIDIRIKQLLLNREVIEREISALQEARKLLLPIYGQTIQQIPSIEEFIEAGDVGITDAVRGALRLNSVHRLTATQIRDIVVSHGFDLNKYTNAMATIHQVLQRLVKAGQVTPLTHGGDKAFQWIEKPASPPTTPEALPALTEVEMARGRLDALRGDWKASRKAKEDFMRGPSKENK
jgi:hypothetical protein